MTRPYALCHFDPIKYQRQRGQLCLPLPPPCRARCSALVSVAFPTRVKLVASLSLLRGCLLLPPCFCVLGFTICFRSEMGLGGLGLEVGCALRCASHDLVEEHGGLDVDALTLAL